MEAPRYFVTYRRRRDGRTVTRAFGRFPDIELAQRMAREHFDVAGCDVLLVRRETAIEALHYRIARVITRAGRIALGSGLTLLAWHALFRNGPRVADVPLGRLTLSMALTFGLHGVLMVAALVFCWDIAFGEGPQNRR